MRPPVSPLSVCSEFGDGTTGMHLDFNTRDKFRGAVTAVLVILRLRSAVRQRNASNSMYRVCRQLDLTKSKCEQEFFSKAVNSAPLMCKVTELLTKFFEHHLDDTILQAAVSMAHHVKCYTLRICWKDFIEPLRQSAFKHQQEHQVLTAQFQEARLSYLKELSSLRDKARCRADPLKGIAVDPLIYWEPQQMATPEEKDFLNTAVVEIVKTVFESDPKLTERLAIERIEKMQETGESLAVESLKKQLLETRGKLASMQKEATEFHEKETQKRISERWEMLRRARKAASAGLSEKVAKNMDSVLESEVLKSEDELRRAQAEIKELKTLRCELEQQLSDSKVASDYQQRILKHRVNALETQQQVASAEYEDLCEALKQEKCRTSQLSEREASSQEEISTLRSQMQMMQEELMELRRCPQERTDSVTRSSDVDIDMISAHLPISNAKVESRGSICSYTGARRESPTLKINSDLCAAAAEGDTERMQQMLARKHVHDANEPNYDSRTALHVAASKGFLETVVCLVQDMDASVNPVDAWGGTPLDDAVRSKNHDVIEYLRSLGAKSGASVVEAELPKLESRLQAKEEQCACLEKVLQAALEQTCADSMDDAERLQEYSKVLHAELTVTIPDQLSSLNSRLEASHRELEGQLQTLRDDPRIVETLGQDRVQRIFQMKQALADVSHQRRCAQAEALVKSVESHKAENISGASTARKSKCSNCEKLREELDATRALLNEVQGLSTELAAKYKKSSEENLTNSAAIGHLRNAVSSAAKSLSESDAFLKQDQNDTKLTTCVEALMRAEKQTTWSRLYQGGDERSKARRAVRMKRLLQDIHRPVSSSPYLIDVPLLRGTAFAALQKVRDKSTSKENTPRISPASPEAHEAERVGMGESSDASNASSVAKTSKGSNASSHLPHEMDPPLSSRRSFVSSHGRRRSSKGSNGSSQLPSEMDSLPTPRTSFVNSLGGRSISKGSNGSSQVPSELDLLPASSSLGGRQSSKNSNCSSQRPSELDLLPASSTSFVSSSPGGRTSSKERSGNKAPSAIISSSQRRTKLIPAALPTMTELMSCRHVGG
eukprot:TRINITY_DN3827_c0_g4_i1.p1 TRINITY_DN3827_c0_g4~~TRINITY_DN3827_c0_g4_i1.p1  ORF type:complete len:1069 (+),score=212.28 TRINITY_DN3827_c0_g4_i1:71-3277(+)